MGTNTVFLSECQFWISESKLTNSVNGVDTGITSSSNLSRINSPLLNTGDLFSESDIIDAFSPFSRSSVDEAYKDRKLTPINDYYGLSTLSGHLTNVHSVAYSPNGTIVASGASDGKIILWNVTTGDVLDTISAHGDDVRSVAFHPNGSALASGSDDQTIKLWDVSSGSGSYIDTLSGHSGEVYSVAFSPNGSLLASGSADTTVKLWDVNVGDPAIDTLFGHSGTVYSVSFSSNNSLLASGSSDADIILWDVDTGNSKDTLTDHSSIVRSVAFSSDGEFLASGSADPNIKLWNGTTGALIDTFTGHGQTVRSVAFDSSSELLASGSTDNTVKLWNVTSGTEIRNMTDHFGDVSSVSFSPNGHILSSCSSDDTVKLWNLNVGRKISTLDEHSLGVYSVAFNPNGSLLASGSSDTDIIIWNATDWNSIRTLSGHGNEVFSVAFNPNGSLLASASRDTEVWIWDVNTGTDIHTLDHGSSYVFAVAFSPNGSVLASGSEDDSIKLWDVNTGNFIHSLESHNDDVLSVAFSPDGSMLASASKDQTIKIWNMSTNTVIRTLTNHTDEVNSVTFSPDGSMLASGSNDSSVILWNVNNWTVIHNITDHSLGLRSVAFSPDNTVLASGSKDYLIKTWNVSDGTEIRTLNTSYDVFSVAFSPDGEHIASSFIYTSAVDIWNISTFLFGFDNESSSLVLTNSELDINRNQASLLSAAWNSGSLLPVDNSTSLRAPSNFGQHVLHIQTKYLARQLSRDYPFLVVESFDDFDGDGMPNLWEEQMGLDPLLDDAADDLDNDGLNNTREFQLGTEADNPDTDGDAWKDGSDLEPLVINDPPRVIWPAHLLALNNTYTNDSSWNWVVADTNATSIELWLNGTSQGSKNATGEPITPFNWSIGLSEGVNNITIQAYYDFAHNSYTDTSLVTLDTSKPTISLVSPSSGGVYKSDTTITVAVENYTTLSYYWDEGNYTQASSLDFDLPSGDQTHDLHLKAVNQRGNAEFEVYSFITDDTAPTASISTIPNSVAGTIQITVTPNDVNGIDRVEFELAGTVVKTINSAPYIWEWDTTEKANGRYFIKIYIYDNAGNKFTSPEYTVNIDNPLEIDAFIRLLIVSLSIIGVATGGGLYIRRVVRRKRARRNLERSAALARAKFKEGALEVFISYVTADSPGKYPIQRIAELLEGMPVIKKVYNWQEETSGDIVEYMEKFIAISDTVVFFCSEKALTSKPVRLERNMAIYQGKHIIPIFKDFKHVGRALQVFAGVDAKNMTTEGIVNEIYRLILKNFDEEGETSKET